MSLSHPKTPVHSHPLSPLLQRGRRSREPPRSDSKNTTNCLTLSAQLEPDVSAVPSRVRSHNEYPGTRKKFPSSTLFGDENGTSVLDSFEDSHVIRVLQSEQHNPLVTAHILNTKWHECSDDAIEGAISTMTSIEEPGNVPNHPYFTALRILSSAYCNMAHACQDSQEYRRSMLEKEAARKQRVDDLLRELQPSEREVARRVVQSIFTSDDENSHRVQRQQSSRSLIESLNEAISDEAPLSRSIPKPMAPTAEETTFQLGYLSRSTTDQSTTKTEEGTSTTTHLITVTPPPSQSAQIPSYSGTPLFESKQRSERASVSDWMGGWWSKPKASRSQDGQSMVSSPGSSSSSNTLLGKTPGRRKSTKSVFGTLGISILNPLPNSSSKEPENFASAQADDVESIRSTAPSVAGSVASAIPSVSPPTVLSPIQNTFVSNLAAPTLTTTLDGSPQMASVTSTSPPDPPIVIIQGATLRAIVHATRVMTNDPSSILADQGRDTGVLIAKLAMDLIRNARDEGVNFRDKPVKEKKEVSLAAKEDESTTGNINVVLSPNSGTDATMSLNRALNVNDGLKRRKYRASSVRMISPFVSPLFGSFVRQQHKLTAPPTSRDQPTSTASLSTNATIAQPTSTPTKTKPKSVPLESIIPATSKPPTHYLSRIYAHTPLTSRNFRFSIPLAVPTSHLHSASRFSVHDSTGDSSGQPPLTDRYGFMYDVALYDILLLMRARECGNSAPACLTGVKIADREEDDSWPEDDEDTLGARNGRMSNEENIEVVKGKCLCDEEMDIQSVRSSERVEGDREGLQSSADARSISRSSSKRTFAISSGPTITSTCTNSNSAGGPTFLATSILSVNEDTPRHVCVNTIRKLLDQLSDIHDQQQAAQQKEWKEFAKHRSLIKSTSNKPSASTQVSAPANTLLGVSIGLGLTSDTSAEDEDADELGHTEGLINFAQLGLSSARDERREFDRLVRNGVPLYFRSKVWMECSGALELREPGLFRDLLEVKTEEGSGSVVAEIEKDVGRTMPLNIFFGGDGVGVDKLKRVLVAYSRRNPAVGYCQGMNLITSTILLVHADEEDAFWMLAVLVEKILPKDFFSPSLLPSRACPLVLLDYVVEHLPKLHAHLTELGIDLGAICFSWFLSLFTDCLPVETLFRVWDIFLVDGLDVLFRIALGILRRNETELLSCQSIPAVYVALENLPTRMWETDRLLQAEAELRSILVHSDIAAKQRKHIATLSQLVS